MAGRRFCRRNRKNRRGPAAVAFDRLGKSRRRRFKVRMTGDRIEQMSKLQPPDAHYLVAAIGWLELGNHVEAGEEIAKISPAFITHPDVLEVRWAVCASGQSWEAALLVAEILVGN